MWGNRRGRGEGVRSARGSSRILGRGGTSHSSPSATKHTRTDRGRVVDLTTVTGPGSSSHRSSREG